MNTREAFEKLGQPRHTALFGPLFRGEAPIRSDDITKDPRYGLNAPHKGMPPGHLPVRSYLGVPVILRSGEAAGGLLFGHPDPGMFTERTETIIAGLAAQAAIAIDNARLYEGARNATKEREQLLDRERVAREEAERMSKAKDEFLAMLAHELHNPLAPVSSAAELLSRAHMEPERVKAASSVIVRQVNHMTELINDLLDVSRVTRGLVSLSQDVVDIKHVISDSVEQVRPVIDSRGHSLALHLGPGRVHVRGDHKRLVQVLVNILGNAAKYTPPGGRIELRTEENDKEVIIHVTDTGIGISPRLLPGVFDLFTQGERTSDRTQGGLWLGLALVKSLVQLHGGAVSAQSAGPGAGSTFTVRLPRLAVPVAEAPAPDLPQPDHATRPLKVLLVDDNVDAAVMLAEFLKFSGHHVTVFHDPQEALARAEREVFDACLLDIGLPQMDGNELAQRLRALPTTKSALFIAVTGYGQPFDRERAELAGFDHFLVKPVKPGDVLDLLANRELT